MPTAEEAFLAIWNKNKEDRPHALDCYKKLRIAGYKSGETSAAIKKYTGHGVKFTKELEEEIRKATQPSGPQQLAPQESPKTSPEEPKEEKHRTNK